MDLFYPTSLQQSWCISIELFEALRCSKFLLDIKQIYLITFITILICHNYQYLKNKGFVFRYNLTDFDFFRWTVLLSPVLLFESLIFLSTQKLITRNSMWSGSWQLCSGDYRPSHVLFPFMFNQILPVEMHFLNKKKIYDQ